MDIDEKALNIYTDGSSYSSPRVGGTGILFVSVDSSGEEITEEFPSYIAYAGATNQQMELQASILALKKALKMDISIYSKIIIYTDSLYLVENYKKAIYQWSQQKWKRSSGAPVLNAEQWKELGKTIKKIYDTKWKKVEFKWVKGHAKNKYNKAVDKLAKQSTKIPIQKRISIVKTRRKKFKNSKVVIGSVKMQGQKISIYIVNDEYLKVHKINRYRYQVVSKKSPFYKYTDFITSRESLRAGHYYYVRFNKDNNNPLILKVFHEIENKG